MKKRNKKWTQNLELELRFWTKNSYLKSQIIISGVTMIPE